MVQARMMLKAQATTEDLLLGANLHSIVYSLCLPSDRAYLSALGCHAEKDLQLVKSSKHYPSTCIARYFKHLDCG